jgi:hypothetical protein
MLRSWRKIPIALTDPKRGERTAIENTPRVRCAPFEQSLPATEL